MDGLSEILYLARAANSWEINADTTALLGVSGLHGPNDTGNDGETWIYGGDFTLKWRPRSGFRGWPFVAWQTELIARDYEADSAPADALPSNTLRDVGGYTQVLYGFRPGWVHASIGLWALLLGIHLAWGLPRLKRTVAAAEASLATGTPSVELQKLVSSKAPGIVADVSALGIVVLIALMVLKPF